MSVAGQNSFARPVRFAGAHGCADRGAGRRIASEEGLSLKAARVEVESDRERQGLARRHYRQDLRDPLSHDLTINTAELTIEAATEVVLAAVQQKLA